MIEITINVNQEKTEFELFLLRVFREFKMLNLQLQSCISNPPHHNITKKKQNQHLKILRSYKRKQINTAGIVRNAIARWSPILQH